MGRHDRIGAVLGHGHSPAALAELGAVFAEAKAADLKALGKQFVKAIAQHRDFSHEETRQAARVPA